VTRSAWSSSVRSGDPRRQPVHEEPHSNHVNAGHHAVILVFEVMTVEHVAPAVTAPRLSTRERIGTLSSESL
jgi:hypothetical protein